MTASNAGTGAATGAKEQELVMVRQFDAPRELVWRAWTECDHVRGAGRRQDEDDAAPRWAPRAGDMTETTGAGWNEWFDKLAESLQQV
jgi:uncharacterized protein YndB with AHSA1/START domain